MANCYRCGSPADARACLTTSENAEKGRSRKEGTYICAECLAELNAYLQGFLPGAHVVMVPKENADA